MNLPKSVAGILFADNRRSVLLVQRCDVPVWVLPGGGIDRGETPESAVIREIVEETGFQIKVRRLVGTYHPINRLARSTHLYECEITGGEPRCSEETRDVRWFPLASLPKRLPPPYPEWIADAVANLPPVRKAMTSVNYWTFCKYLCLHPILVGRFLLARLGMPFNSHRSAIPKKQS